jgi:hypothetical protein
MAVSAIKSELSGVELVIVGNRLRGLVSNSGVLGSGVVSDASYDCSSNHTQGNNEFNWYSVDPARKNITHWINGV